MACEARVLANNEECFYLVFVQSFFKNHSISILFKLNFIKVIQNGQLYRTEQTKKKLWATHWISQYNSSSLNLLSLMMFMYYLCGAHAYLSSLVSYLPPLSGLLVVDGSGIATGRLLVHTPHRTYFLPLLTFFVVNYNK